MDELLIKTRQLNSLALASYELSCTHFSANDLKELTGLILNLGTDLQLTIESLIQTPNHDSINKIVR
ncbi:hypothetical protein [Morganella morganii]|uniref:hypothetical protein n=1 Tax=Morganella morganii TaxID=582 RepID=UPI00076B0DD3|nr:hypothetical protein [Morganella morganii]AMG69481.1 hypothetical protein AL531_03520 [Morganella morganii]EKU4288575.1 hypothetical protein [Morganella morganii]EKU4303884.1 hypothetical protein [Morganella morganii]EKU5661595.1 hypothetical protein [Morganella morganii]EKU5688945.1 hypothetical protein [Morganella morganii]